MRTTKVTLAGGVVALALVAGGAGMAIAHAQGTASPAAATATPTGTATSTASPTGKPAKGSKAANAAKGDKVAAKQILGKVKDFQHAEWVTKGDANAYVTHDAILGQVSAVSSTAITVKSADGTSMTFAVNADTTVHQRHTKGSTSTTTPTMADVKTGQTVLVAGAKSPDLTAKNVLLRTS